METVVRVVVLYAFLMVALRVIGKRELSRLAPFELVTLILIPQMVQLSIVGEDYSMTNAIIGACTLLALVFFTSLGAFHLERVRRFVHGDEVILVRHGRIDECALSKERITPQELVGEMRKSGLERLEQVRWAILDGQGAITFVPEQTADQQIKARESSPASLG